MPLFCSCTTSLANTGAPSSQRVISIGIKLIAVPLIADDGSLNHISNVDVIDETFVNAKLNNVDKSKRWFPLGEFVNVAETREEVNYQQFDDGTRVGTRKGLRTWSGMLLSHSSRYLAKLEGLFCQRFGIFTVDNCGNLVGDISNDGAKLYPIAVNNEAFIATLQKATFTEAGGIMLTFDFRQSVQDKNLRQINASEMSVDMLRIEGLRDVASVISSITTDGFTAALTLPFDEFLGSALPATGWVLADFDLYNITTAASITISSVTESGSTGVYAFVIPTQTTADVLRLRSDKDGFDLGDVSITIP